MLPYPVRYLDGSGLPAPVRAPEVGEHTDSVLGDLGYDAARIERLRLAGVVT
jgi:crotonobetainyl-CoA:carnitine CoA-transferase CaiB-like acyl-CoA transferase